MLVTFYTVLLLGSALVAVGLVAGMYSSRVGVSHLLVFLVVGMLAGVDGPLGLSFSDHRLSFGLGNVALALILLDGGVRTPWSSLRLAWAPAFALASVGVVATSAIVGAAAAWMLRLDWQHALLLGAVVAPTDAAAVFGQLRRSGIALPQRLAATIEIESGFNDPMAVFIVVSLIALAGAPATESGSVLVLFVQQFVGGVAIGVAAGRLAAAGLRRLPMEPPEDGLGALLLASLALAAYAVAGLLDASGFLAAYLCGLVCAHHAPRSVAPLLGALNGHTWIAQSVLFLLLGLLVTPHELMRLATPALVVALVLMFVARPAAVALCLTPLGFGWREQLFAGWVGLRGAVPIVLAGYPVIAGLEGGQRTFDLAFVVVLASLLLQGPSVGALARRLGLDPGAERG